MKKLLLCGILALAAGSMAFAQWPDWFSVSGDVKTGLRADFLGGAYSQSGTDTNANVGDNPLYIDDARDRHGLSMWHDDAGNRARIDMKFELENIGFRFIPKWEWYSNDKGNDITTGIWLDAAWGWFELMNDMIRISMGKIDDGRWQSPTPEDFNFSNTNAGVRIEVMPIEGLNLGWVLGKEYADNLDNYTNPDDGRKFGLEGAGIERTFRDMFVSSAFGAKYESSMFTVAAGLDLRGEGVKRQDIGWGFGGKGDPVGGWNSIDSSSVSNEATMGRNNVASTAYLGLQIKPMEALTLQAGGKVINLDDIEKFGGLWLNEKIAYNLGTITPRLVMHQKFVLADRKYAGWTDTDGANVPVYMEFVPGVDIALADNLSAYAEIPVKLWDEVFEIGVKPGVNYKLASNLELGCYYQFILTNISSKYWKDAGFDAAIRNTVQMSFNWTF